MDKDKVKGVIDDAAGRAKRQVGEWTGDPGKQVEGAAQQVKGKVEGAWGKAKVAVHDAVEDTEVHLDASVTLKSKNAAADAECKKCN